MIQSMPKWILASVASHFNAGRGTYPMYLEGQKRDTNSLQDWFELRMNGPDISEMSKNYFRFDILINTEIMSAYNDRDMFRVIKFSGALAKLFTNKITIRKYGDEITDDRSVVVGCLQLNGDIKIIHYGRVKPEVDMNVSQVEASYYFETEITRS